VSTRAGPGRAAEPVAALRRGTTAVMSVLQGLKMVSAPASTVCVVITLRGLLDGLAELGRCISNSSRPVIVRHRYAGISA